MRKNWRLRCVLALISIAVISTRITPASAQNAAEGYALNKQAVQLYNQGKFAEATEVAKRALAILEKALGPDHPDVGTALNNLGGLYRAQGRTAEAEPPLRRSLALSEKAQGLDHPNVGKALNSLAELYRVQGRYAEAEPLYRRSLALLEKALGPNHPDVGSSVGNLASLYDSQGRAADAEPLYKRSLAIYEKAVGPDHTSLGTTLNNLASLYDRHGRRAEAEPLYKRSLAIYENALGPDHPFVGRVLNNLAELHRAQGRYAEAGPLYKRSLAMLEKQLGPDHPNVATALNNLAALYDRQGHTGEAQLLFQRSLALREKVLGPEHPEVGESLNNLASLYFAQRDWTRAADFWRRSTAVIVRRAQRGTDDVGQALTGRKKAEGEQASYRFRNLVKAAHRQALASPGVEPGLSREVFLAAQWALSSEAAGSLAQMAARGAKGDVLGVLVRERQDLVGEWQKRDASRNAAVAQTPDKRDNAAEAANAVRLAAIDKRIADIDKRLVTEFPDYAALARSTPLAADKVQAQLGAEEALVLVLDTHAWQPAPEETFIWVITKSDMRWVRSELGTPALAREVAALRCGLDAALWEDESSSAKCRDLLKSGPPRDGSGSIRTETLPFDTARAHALYKALFGAVEDLIRDKHLLIVPSGPLTQLPFQVLVTKAADGADGARPSGSDPGHRTAAWLAKAHAITILPAVSSLQALRRVARPSTASKPMLGVGNPLLDGDPVSRPWEAQWARLAREKQSCAPTTQQVAGLAKTRRGRAALRVATRDGRADLAHLRSQSPLHDTADELCAVAADLKLAPDDILLGARATETAIKARSSEGRLAQYRVLHFATHGTIAGEIEGTAEPGLILTPPKEQSEQDDGYLSASEVAALKLDADWVILSACNTAAGGAQGAEALSGLARAFIYAGARAMLVSHWAVDSAATVKLVTSAVGAITRDAKMGRAEALRRAMLGMIEAGGRDAHPALWAPFIVVGEGASPK